MLPILAGLGVFLSGAMGAASSLKQASAAARQAEFNAMQADDDAIVAQDNARLVMEQAYSEERKVRVMGRKVMGEMRVSVGASGLQNDGSALELLAESAANMESDALNVRMMGNYAAGSYRKDASRKRKYADMLREGAGDIMLGGALSAGGQLLGSTADFLGKLPEKKDGGGKFSMRRTS